MADNAAFQVIRSDGDILQLVGELDLSTVPILRAAIASVLPDTPSALDLSGLTFIDSSGLHELANQAASRNGTGPLVLVNVSDHIATLLGIVGLDTLPTIEIR